MRLPKAGDRILLIADHEAKEGHDWIVPDMYRFLGTVQTVSDVTKSGQAFRIDGSPEWWCSRLDIAKYLDDDGLQPATEDELADFIGF